MSLGLDRVIDAANEHNGICSPSSSQSLGEAGRICPGDSRPIGKRDLEAGVLQPCDRADKERSDAFIVSLHLRRRVRQGTNHRERFDGAGERKRAVVLEEDDALFGRGQGQRLSRRNVDVRPAELTVRLVVRGVEIAETGVESTSEWVWQNGAVGHTGPTKNRVEQENS